ncbi:reprolysin-like metallopeptidase [Flavobacterium sp.]|uniref:reprolysin-like metallopeptidase n=1 Tax=Flavobacterium sp. TaxID=239 RepID=UPI0026195B36|nr:GEVED domain-containing protein [Flavobacterium sp.]
MKNRLLSIAFIAITSFSFAQSGKAVWKAAAKNPNAVTFANKQSIVSPRLFSLDVNQLKQSLNSAPRRFASNAQSNTIVSFPNAQGVLENFRVKESSNMDPALAARYSDIKSYIGQGVENPASTIYFSLSPLGLQTMVVKADQSAEFIEPYTTDLSTYTVYRKSDKAASLTPFECRVAETANAQIRNTDIAARPNADDAILRTFRLAMSVTGEYTVYFGGTKALALAAINNTMTRVNGVFEKDFGARMVLIANTDAVIYTSASTDPYSAAATGSGGAWNAELQNTLTSVIGEANYDIGHLFGASGGGGNAGCIGCICTNGSKGSGFTSPGDAIPSGDNFDIDYVAHEMGHQFGANHTFTHSNEGTGVQMEPGSGSTIMGYAGITSLDVQPHSDPYFHAVSIQQVTNNIKTKTCSVNTATGNAIPTAGAGLDYTIPKSTPFMLTGTSTDANGDALTYDWEQMDSQTNATAPSATKTSGVNFRSYNPTTSPVRYFPKMSSVLTGATTTAGTELTVEALPSVARTLNFRMTVRDNRAGGSANNSDDMIVTVNATAGPFAVSSPNTAVSYPGGSSQTVTWAVAGTTANGVNCANVDILLSTNGGTTWTTLLAATPNDGTEAVTIPNTPGTTNRIMVKGTNHIFFDVSNTNFTITSGTTDTVAPTAPTLAASGTTQTNTVLSWSGATDNVAVTGYDIYKDGVLLNTVASSPYTVSGLVASTTYVFTVKAKDAAGNASVASNGVSVTTSAPVVDTTAPTAATLSASGTTSSTTNLSWSGATDNIGVTAYDVYQNGAFKATVAATTYAVTGLSASTTYTFYVIAKDAAGNASPASNTVSVTTLVASLAYCTSQGNSTADEKIGKVVFGTISNTSTGATGYENFTALSSNASRGAAYTITITPAWTTTTYAEGYAVFIDYNQNGVFTDAGETVWTKAAATTTPVSGTFTIPATATLGAARMRVSMKYNGIPTSCEAFSFGQVEDYTVNIQVGVVDTTAPTAATLAASGTTSTTTNLSWSGATDNVGVTAYDVYQNGVFKATVATTTYAVTGLSAATAYTFYVIAKDAAGNASPASNTANVTTTTATLTYCTSQGNNTADERIGKVVLGSISNTSTGTTGYENFTALSTNAVRSTAYTITITPAWTSTVYAEGYAVFIDYNKNGVFTDAGETVWTKTASTTTPVSGTFTIPATATLGATRMRVSMKYNGVPTSCEAFSYGQVEDYTINITSTAREIEDNVNASTLSFNVYPNPVNGDMLYISSVENATYKVFNVLGQEISRGKIENEAIPVSNIQAGTYLLEVTSNGQSAVKRFIKK